MLKASQLLLDNGYQHLLHMKLGYTDKEFYIKRIDDLYLIEVHFDLSSPTYSNYMFVEFCFLSPDNDNIITIHYSATLPETMNNIEAFCKDTFEKLGGRPMPSLTRMKDVELDLESSV